MRFQDIKVSRNDLLAKLADIALNEQDFIVLSLKQCQECSLPHNIDEILSTVPQDVAVGIILNFCHRVMREDMLQNLGMTESGLRDIINFIKEKLSNNHNHNNKN